MRVKLKFWWWITELVINGTIPEFQHRADKLATELLGVLIKGDMDAFLNNNTDSKERQ